MRKVLNGASHKKAKIKRRQRRFISKISYLGDRQPNFDFSSLFSFGQFGISQPNIFDSFFICQLLK
jgi:hypothetical protein